MPQSETYRKLSDFISKKMRMSHIYQPVMLIELMKHEGTADVSDIAKALLVQDVSQVEYYEHITKNMVGKVLTKNRGLTERNKNDYHLIGFKDLSPDEVSALTDLCLSKIDEYIGKRGDKIWSHRKMSSGYISGTLRYEVLKRAKFRCELCGISADDKALEVDHIIPRNNDGTDDISNLQSLCYSCNAMKRDRDDTDFRGMAESYKEREKGCIFCEVEASRIIAENELCYAIRDNYPVTELHSLIIPKRHTLDYFDLHQPELNAVQSILDKLKTEVEQLDETVTGFNVGVNSGEDAGQTIHHCHIHLIPRRKGDVENPRGGVRGVIPSKQDYSVSVISELTNPILLYSRSAVLSEFCPVPQERGLYAWFFKEVPPGVPTDGCVTKDGMTLLYVGICPKNDSVSEDRNLRTRIKSEHFNGNAEGSTLRQTLGILLSEQSDFPLRRVGSGTRMTLTHLGENWLDAWMEENAFVAWVKHPAPWEVEKEIIERVSLPLNIQDNKHHPFYTQLREIRTKAKNQAREMPIANEDNQQRRM